MSDGLDREDYRALGAALTGTVIYAAIFIVVYWYALQRSIWLGAAWVLVAFVEARLGLLHDVVAYHLQPYVNRLWGVSREEEQ